MNYEVKVWCEPTDDYEGNNYAIYNEFWSINGCLTFAPGETEQVGLVYLNQDENLEGDETFLVRLSKPDGATITDGEGIMTIIDDD